MGPKKNVAAFSILIVDDDTVATDTMRLIVGRQYPDARVYTAENGRVGLELFTEYRPEIIITDIDMPEMTGIIMASEIKAIKNDAKFIVVTGNSNSDPFEDFSDIGFCDFMIKPINLKQLFTVIEGCLAEIVPDRRLVTRKVLRKSRVPRGGKLLLRGAYETEKA